MVPTTVPDVAFSMTLAATPAAARYAVPVHSTTEYMLPVVFKSFQVPPGLMCKLFSLVLPFGSPTFQLVYKPFTALPAASPLQYWAPAVSPLYQRHTPS